MNECQQHLHNLARVVDMYATDVHPEYREGFRDALGVTREQVEREQARRAFIEYYEEAHEATPTPPMIARHMSLDGDARWAELQILWRMRR
jgi:hypothetical protein